MSELDDFAKRNPGGTLTGALGRLGTLANMSDRDALFHLKYSIIPKAEAALDAHSTIADHLNAMTGIFQDPNAKDRIEVMKSEMKRIGQMYGVGSKDAKTTPQKGQVKVAALNDMRRSLVDDNPDVQKMSDKDLTAFFIANQNRHRELHDRCLSACENLLKHATKIHDTLDAGGDRSECQSSFGQVTGSLNNYLSSAKKLSEGGVRIGSNGNAYKSTPFRVHPAMGGFRETYQKTVGEMSSVAERMQPEDKKSTKPVLVQPERPDEPSVKSPEGTNPSLFRRITNFLRRDKPAAEQPTNPSKKQKEPRKEPGKDAREGMVSFAKSLTDSIGEVSMPKYLSENNDIYLKDAMAFAKYILENSGKSYSEAAVIDLANSMIDRIKRFNLNEWRKQHRARVQQYVSEKLLMEFDASDYANHANPDVRNHANTAEKHRAEAEGHARAGNTAEASRSLEQYSHHLQKAISASGEKPVSQGQRDAMRGSTSQVVRNTMY